MLSVSELEQYLSAQGADFELIRQEKSIYSAQDAAEYYNIEKAAPTFILEHEHGLIACIVSINQGKLNFEAMKRQLGYSKLKMADRKKIEKQTGYPVGALPLLGHGLTCIFDENLLRYDYIYGGTGDEFVTLKIAPNDVKRLNQVVASLEHSNT